MLRIHPYQMERLANREAIGESYCAFSRLRNYMYQARSRSLLITPATIPAKHRPRSHPVGQYRFRLFATTKNHQRVGQKKIATSTPNHFFAYPFFCLPIFLPTHFFAQVPGKMSFPRTTCWLKHPKLSRAVPCLFDSYQSSLHRYRVYGEALGTDCTAVSEDLASGGPGGGFLPRLPVSAIDRRYDPTSSQSCFRKRSSCDRASSPAHRQFGPYPIRTDRSALKYPAQHNSDSLTLRDCHHGGITCANHPTLQAP